MSSAPLLKAAVCVVLALAFCGGVARVEAADNIALQWYELQDRVLFAPLGSGPVRGPNRVRHPTPISFSLFFDYNSYFYSIHLFYFYYIIISNY